MGQHLAFDIRNVSKSFGTNHVLKGISLSIEKGEVIGMIGSSGADSFVFNEGFGQDDVADYVDGSDRLDFTLHAGVTGLGDLQITQSGGNAVITLAAGGTDQITLLNVSSGVIDAGDFDFV